MKKLCSTLVTILLVSVFTFASPAHAGPAAATASAYATAQTCGSVTVASGPFGLACFGFGGFLSIVLLFTPTP